MTGPPEDRATDIVGRLARRHSTAAVLLHHALAERMGVGPTDLKCLDILRERGPLTGSALASITGLTTGAITGVVARLEGAGFLRREQDARDGRKQLLHPSDERAAEVHAALAPIRADLAGALEGFDAHQLDAIASFLARATDLTWQHVALLRGRSRLAPGAEGDPRPPGGPHG